MDNFDVALQLLGIGMLTVFTILFLVVFLGNLIIRFVNRFIPEIQKVSANSPSTSSGIDSNKMAAIVAAVQIVTSGKGKVVNVEKK